MSFGHELRKSLLVIVNEILIRRLAPDKPVTGAASQGNCSLHQLMEIYRSVRSLAMQSSALYLHQIVIASAAHHCKFHRCCAQNTQLFKLSQHTFSDLYWDS